MKKVVLSVAALLGISYVMDKLSLKNNLQYNFAGIELNGSLLSTKFIVKIEIINPTNASVTVQNIKGAIALNGLSVGYAEMIDKMKIEKQSRTILKLNCQLLNIATLQQIIYSISRKQGNFNFTGTFQADMFTIPINFNYSL